MSDARGAVSGMETEIVPRSPSIIVHHGPASTRVKSNTLMPFRSDMFLFASLWCKEEVVVTVLLCLIAVFFLVSFA